MLFWLLEKQTVSARVSGQKILQPWKNTKRYNLVKDDKNDFRTWYHIKSVESTMLIQDYKSSYP